MLCVNVTSDTADIVFSMQEITHLLVLYVQLPLS